MILSLARIVHAINLRAIPSCKNDGMGESELVIEAYNRTAAAEGWVQRADLSLKFEGAELGVALSYWQFAAGDRDIPARTDLRPQLMKQFLPRLLLLDAVREEKRTRFRVRHSGTAIDARFGANTGAFLDEAYPEPYASRWTMMAGLSLRVRRPIRLSGSLGYQGMTYMTLEALLAPLGSNPNAPDGVFLVLYLQPNKQLLQAQAVSVSA